MFTKDTNGFPRLPQSAVRSFLHPLNQVVSTVMPTATSELIRTYERLAKEKPTVPVLKCWNVGGVGPLCDLLVELEKEEVSRWKNVHDLVEEDVQEASEDGQDEDMDRSTESNSTLIWKRLALFAHTEAWPLFQPRNNTGRPRSTNPFDPANHADVPLWRPSVVFNIIARRVGYGNRELYSGKTATRGLVVASKGFIKSMAARVSGETKDGQGSTAVSQDDGIVDQAAFRFVKKHGARRWLAKIKGRG